MRRPVAFSCKSLFLVVAATGCTPTAEAPDGGGSADLTAARPPDLGGRDGSGTDGGGGPAPDLAMNPCPDAPFSSFAEASIRFTGGRCRFSLAEAKAGIVIPWELVVTKDVPNVIPEPLDGGGCGRPGPSGLILFESLSGIGQTYCLCDVGLCMRPPPTPVAITGGVFPGEFEWDGLNWMGPSDTNNPKGAAFPPGTYDLLVQSAGKYQSGGAEFSFVVRNILKVTITP